MHAHPIPTHKSTDYFDLIDEEFDNFGSRQPFSRKPLREQATLLCDGKTWDDSFDSEDMMCELE